MNYLSPFWRNTLTLYFIFLTIITIYTYFTYQDPYPGVPDLRGANHTALSNLISSGLELLLYGNFLRLLLIQWRYGMSHEELASFYFWLFLYWLLFGVVETGFYIIVTLLRESMYGEKYSISWLFVLYKAIEIYFLWRFLFMKRPITRINKN